MGTDGAVQIAQAHADSFHMNGDDGYRLSELKNSKVTYHTHLSHSLISINPTSTADKYPCGGPGCNEYPEISLRRVAI